MRIDEIGTSWEFLNNFEQIETRGVKHIALSSGIELIFMDAWFASNNNSIFIIDEAPLEFSFYLAGSGEATLIHSAATREQVTVSPGKAMISFLPGCRCHVRTKKNQLFREINMYIAPERLYAFLEGDLSQVPSEIYALLEKNLQTPFNLEYVITPATRMILDQIYSCPYQGTFRTLYIESKGIELMLRLMWEMAHQRENETSCSLSSQDRKQICHARDILIRQIGAPPSLKKLAREAGLNDTKLKKGFRQIFGTTVFGYLRQYRMEEATRLLSSGQINVDETAQSLGFHDAAHFIRQFRQHYGTTPGTFLKKQKKAGM